jgi:prophage regulatory protein
MGVAEIAQRLGVSRSRAAQIVRERTFPEPAARLIGIVIWETADVERWVAEHRPPPVNE